MKELNIFAMRRSGQHAILNWICQQNKPCYHINAAQGKNKHITSYTNEGRKLFKKGNGFNSDEYNWNFCLKNWEDVKINNEKENIIVIIRDPINLLASRIKSRNSTDCMDIWKNHVKSKHYKIIFDKWFADIEYRKKIANDLNFEFTDKGLNEIFFNATSSFDRKKFNGKAQKMDVLNRHKNININIDNKIKKLWENLL